MRKATLILLASAVLCAGGFFAGGIFAKYLGASQQPASATCSSVGMTAPPHQAGLPPEVEATREAILAAALACDVEALARLAPVESGFAYSLGEPSTGGDPAAFWRTAEEVGEPLLRGLVELLRLPYARSAHGSRDEPVYVWPSAAGEEPSAADWRAAARLYGPDHLALMQEAGAYTGYRVGITLDGRWVFFIEGESAPR